MIIDTGETFRPMAMDRVTAILDGIADSLPIDATQSQRDAAIIAVVLGDLRKPKKLETVRRHLCMLWPLIAPLTDTEPDQFDAILLEFAEIVTTLG